MPGKSWPRRSAADAVSLSPDHRRTSATWNASLPEEGVPDMTGERKNGFRIDSDGAAGGDHSAARLSLHATLRARSELVAIEHPMHSLARWLAINSADRTTGHLQRKAATKLARPCAPRVRPGTVSRAKRTLSRTISRLRSPYLRANWMSLKHFWEPLLDDLLK
jgi:hypothetical protein